jgi:hypothetical protein
MILLFELIIEVEKLKDILAGLDGLIMDAVFDFKKDSVGLQGMDLAGVVWIDMQIDKKAFVKYESDDYHQLCVSMQEFYKNLKRFSGEIIMKLGKNEAEILLIQENPYKRVSIRLLDIPLKHKDAVEGYRKNKEVLDFLNYFEMKVDSLDEIVSDVEDFSDVILFDVSEKAIGLSAKKAEANYDFIIGDLKKTDILKNIKIKKRQLVMIPIEYIKKCLKSGKIAEYAKIDMKQEYPMRMVFEGNNMKLIFIIAPRVLEDGFGREYDTEPSKILENTNKKTVIKG